eukprot:scaffold6758_cov124-Amphora_coffeaeformis.AAC.1
MAKPRGGNSDPHDQNGIPIHDHIHNRLEFYFNSLSLPWKSPMQFPMYVGLLCAHALPTMAGREYTTRVKAIMTDGDSHEMEELDLAIDHYMP